MVERETTHEVALTIPPKSEYLVFSRLVLAGLGRVHPIGEEALSDLKLAVTEACSNAIRHAYRDGLGGDVELRYELGPNHVTVEVRDGGRGFDLELADVRPEDLQEEGMGIAIIHALVDEVELETGTAGDGSRLRLTKYLE